MFDYLLDNYKYILGTIDIFEGVNIKIQIYFLINNVSREDGEKKNWGNNKFSLLFESNRLNRVGKIILLAIYLRNGIGSSFYQ